MSRFERVLRIALAIGCTIDAGVAVLSIFFQSLLGPLLDFPVKDPALTTLAGGEFLIVALIYALLLRDLERFRPFLWLVCLDQFFAGILVLYTVAIHEVAATPKIVGPIPFNLALAALFAVAARKKTA